MLAEPINWGQLVDRLSGAPAAMVVRTAQDAAKDAVLGGRNVVTQSNLELAIAELQRNHQLAGE
jgi:ATP-dependent 26S proteasome regulatory subunit